MILQALDAYYRRKQTDPDPQNRLPASGLENKEIPFILEIDVAGKLVNLADTRSGEGKKKIGQRFLVPQGIKKTSGVAANLLWDTTEYVLGLDTRGKPERVAEQHTAFRARIEALPETVREDDGIRAVQAFLASFKPETLANLPVFADLQAGNPVMSFRLHGDLGLVCQRPAVVAATAGQSEKVPDGICLVSGQPAVIERLHPAIKGVWGAQTSGANIVSFNLDAFNSYGKAQGANAPLGMAAVFAYTTALNHLLARDSRQRMQVGDTSTVFWASEPHELESAVVDLFGDPPKDDPDRNIDALKALYAAVDKGQFSVGGIDTRFHVLGLAPNAARISIRFWETTTALELARRIKQHFDDITLVHAPHEPEHLSLFRLLTGVALLNKADNIPPNLGGEVMRAILEDLPYPTTLLNLAVQRCRAEQKPSYARAAVIKACLNRWIRSRKTQEMEFLPMLDPANINAAYRLGRLFAVLEKIQEEASPGLNATIRDRYYGAASSIPVTVFPTLLRLKNHHMAKLSRGRATQMEKMLGEIMEGLADFPRQLPLQDQGRFALGYYHQRQIFFTKSTPEESK
ncbi:type I-C CRISPR-associated protein Cas8c/Csd1 [Thiobacillus sp.]|uniref:type I-C CRISPR-associated protein Cas8c/Csd1 n=1 Tax=Thiobacillus sp. TaxID=924 RepID=UPI0025DBA9D8|nr:type I-C CRISPR-associated protein Cas8c/Csd1 [Thiobacillus sp.]